MEDVPILGSGDDQFLVKELLAQSGAPAFVVRAAHVQEVYESLLRRCSRQREEWMSLVKVRLATVHALCGSWEALRPYLADDEAVAELRQLHETLQPRLRMPVAQTSSAKAVRRGLAELFESIQRFNQRWGSFLRDLDLTLVNRLREGYNSYYVLEKECVVRSPRLARQGFEPLPPVTVEVLSCRLPPLSLPRLVGDF